MNAPAQRKWVTTIHVAKSKTGIDEDAYRAILAGCAGVQSASEITTWEQYNSVMAAFKKLGFSLQKKTPADDTERRNPEWITAKQEAYINGLWKIASRAKDQYSLRTMIKRITGSDSITWLKKKDAGKVILALRQIALNAGINPDHPC